MATNIFCRQTLFKSRRKVYNKFVSYLVPLFYSIFLILKHNAISKFYYNISHTLPRLFLFFWGDDPPRQSFFRIPGIWWGILRNLNYFFSVCVLRNSCASVNSSCNLPPPPPLNGRPGICLLLLWFANSQGRGHLMTNARR